MRALVIAAVLIAPPASGQVAAPSCTRLDCLRVLGPSHLAHSICHQAINIAHGLRNGPRNEWIQPSPLATRPFGFVPLGGGMRLGARFVRSGESEPWRAEAVFQWLTPQPLQASLNVEQAHELAAALEPFLTGRSEAGYAAAGRVGDLEWIIASIDDGPNAPRPALVLRVGGRTAISTPQLVATSMRAMCEWGAPSSQP